MRRFRTYEEARDAAHVAYLLTLVTLDETPAEYQRNRDPTSPEVPLSVPRIHDRDCRPLRPAPIDSAGVSSSVKPHNGQEAGMDGREEARAARDNLGVTLQEVLRALKETQAQIEEVRVEVATHIRMHESDRRSWWRRVFEGSPSDRKPW